MEELTIKGEFRSKQIFFYRREFGFGFDQISFCCFSEKQAEGLLNDTVSDPSEWFYHHSLNLDTGVTDLDDY